MVTCSATSKYGHRMTNRVKTAEIYEDLRLRLTTAHFAPGTKLKPSEL